MISDQTFGASGGALQIGVFESLHDLQMELISQEPDEDFMDKEIIRLHDTIADINPDEMKWKASPKIAIGYGRAFRFKVKLHFDMGDDNSEDRSCTVGSGPI